MCHTAIILDPEDFVRLLQVLDETFVLMNSRNSALAIYMQKDEIIRKHQQEKETTPENQKQSMRDAYEKCEYQRVFRGAGVL